MKQKKERIFKATVTRSQMAEFMITHWIPNNVSNICWFLFFLTSTHSPFGCEQGFVVQWFERFRKNWNTTVARKKFE